MIGILPTLARHHLMEEAIAPDERYRLLNEQMLTGRGEPIRLDIAGGDPLTAAPEHLVADFDSIAPEAACTSMQLHLQCHPDSFPAYWNAAQCLARGAARDRRELAVPAGRPPGARTRIPLSTVL